MEENKDYTRKIFSLLLFFAVILFFALLKWTYAVSMPISVSILIALLFYPLLSKMHKIHIPWVVSIIFVLLITLIICGITGRLLSNSVQAIIASYPKYEDRFKSIYLFFVETFHLDYDENVSLLNNLLGSEKIRTWLQSFALSLSSNLFNTSKNLLMIFLLLLFLLLEVRSIKVKARTAFEETNLSGKVPAMAIKIIRDITQYVSIKFLASLVTGVIVYLGLLVIHMDFPIIWGFLSFILNFIPTFGSIISWIATTAFALLQYFPQWGYVVYVGILLLAVNQIIGNFIEPRIEGKGLGISPFIILVSLTLWGYIWGFIGMIVAIPFTVILKIIFENTEILKPVSIIIGNTRDLKNSQKKENCEKEKETKEK